jgi:putative ABC transport system permease protein
VAAQLGFGTTLLAVTLTLYAGCLRINRVDPGFVSDRVTAATIPLRGVRYRTAESRAALTTQLLAKVRAIPGVEHAAVGTLMPLSGGLMSGRYQVLGQSSDSSTTTVLRAVSDDFFQTLGIRVEQGRGILRSDDANAAPVVVVNRELVKQAFGDRPALDAIIQLTPPGAESPQAFRIVGIVANAKEKDLLGPDSPIAYFSDAQASFPHTVLAMRSRGALPLALVRGALRELDGSLVLDDVSSLASRVRATYGLQFFLLNVIAVFAAGALVLIAVGVYGAVSFAVTADMRAIGVRIALGATPTTIMASLFARTLTPASVGCVVGLIASIVAIRWLAVAGFGVDVAGSVGGAIAVLVLAMAAISRPAWRARNADPLTVLRGD